MTKRLHQFLIGTILLGLVLLAMPATVFADDEHVDCGTFESPLLMFASVDEDSDTGFGSHGFGPMGRGRMDEGHRKHLDQFRMLKMLEFLNLAEDQEIPFMTAYRSMQRDIREIDEARKEHLNALSDGLGDGSLSDQEIHQLADLILAKQEQKGMRMAAFARELKGILSAQQLGKMIVFHEKFEFELLKAVRGFRDRKGPGGKGSDRGGPRNP